MNSDFLLNIIDSDERSQWKEQFENFRMQDMKVFVLMNDDFVMQNEDSRLWSRLEWLKCT